MAQKIESPKILSICIPTYNRAKYLNSCLLSIFDQSGMDSLPFEVIVSDNCSTDNTQAVANEYLKYSNFKYYRQNKNIGAPKNILGMIKNYAKGDYCWVVGDDDFILQGSIRAIIDLIENNLNINYFYASISGITVDDFNNIYGAIFSTDQYKSKIEGDIEYSNVDKFEELISPKYSIIFLGELMASIFKRELWLSFDLQAEGEYLESLETTYPHSVVLANTFFGQKVIYIKTPLLLALDGAREWWDKLGYVLIIQVRNLLDLYESKGLPNNVKTECNHAYISMTFPYFIKFLLDKKLSYRNKIDFKKYVIFLFKYPFYSFIVAMKYIVRLILVRVKY